MATASVAVRLNAITGEFETAFKGATRTVAGFEKAFAGAASSLKGHQDKINSAFAALSGDKLIAETNQLAAAVAKVGGASKLTEAEQRKVNAAVTEAIAKYKALGQDAPASLQALERATRQVAAVTQPATLASKALGVLSSTFGQFTAASLAASAISNVVGKLGEFVAAGAKLPALEQSFSKLAKTVGQDSQSMLSALQTGTRGLVSNIDLMQSANKAILLGLPVTSKEMGELAKTATVLGRAMGQDATSSLNDLITALGRSSPLILDNLGLTVKVGEANETYAKKLGKTASQLTDAESKMAFYEAAMEAARKKTQEIGEQTKTLGDIVDTVWTSIGNNVTQASGIINQQVGKILTRRESLVEFLKLMAVAGSPGQALAALQSRDSAVTASGTKGPDINLPSTSEQQIKALRDSAKALAAEALIPLTAAQKDLTREFAAGGKNASEIKKELDKYAATAGASEIQISKLLDAQKKSIKEGDGYADVLKRIAAAQIPLTQAQTQEVDRLLRLNIAHSDIAKALHISEVAVDSYADAQKRSNEIIKDLEKAVFAARGELGKLPGDLVPITRAFTELNTLLPPIRLQVQELFGPDGLGKSINVAGLEFPDDGVKEFEADMDEVRRKVDDVANAMRRLGSLFDNVFGRIVSGSADVVQGIGDILTATTAWGKAMAIINLTLNLASKAINLFRDEAHEATNDIRDDFVGLFGPGGTGPGSGFFNLAAQLAKLEGGTAAFHALMDARTPEAFAKAMERVNTVLSHSPEALTAAAGFQTRAQLQAIANDAKTVYEFMRDSGQFTAEQVAQAWQRSRDAQIAALDDVKRSALASDQARVDSLKKTIQDLDREHDSIFASWKAEDDAPEFDAAGNRIFGVVEQQQRARLDQIEAERKKAEEALLEANARIDESFAGLGPSAETAAIAIVDAFSGIEIEIPVHFKVDPLNLGGQGITVPAFAHGGHVDRPTLALIGEAGGEHLVPDAKMDAILRSGGRGGVNVSVSVNGSVTEGNARTLAKEIARELRLGGDVLTAWQQLPLGAT